MNMDLRLFFFLNTWKVKGFGDGPPSWEWHKGTYALHQKAYDVWQMRRGLNMTNSCPMLPHQPRLYQASLQRRATAPRRSPSPQPLAVCASPRARPCRWPGYLWARGQCYLPPQPHCLVPLLTHKLAVPILLSKRTEPREAARRDGGAETPVPRPQDWTVALPSADTADEAS